MHEKHNGGARKDDFLKNLARVHDIGSQTTDGDLTDFNKLGAGIKQD